MKSLVIALALFAGPVSAQSNCLPISEMSAGLSDGYGEYVQTRAFTSDMRVIEIYANTESGSWTATLTTADGLACIVAHGTAYGKINTPMGEDA